MPTIYRITTRNTRTIGFGFQPTYAIDPPVIGDRQRSEDWMESQPVEISLPEGFTIAPNTYGELMLWNATGTHVDIVDDHGHPAIVIEHWTNKNGKPFTRYRRLDK